MRLRPMSPRDSVAVADLTGQLGYPSTPEQIRERFAALSRDPESAILVAEDEDGGLIGWVHVIGRRALVLDPYAELGGLVVDAAARRQGAGRALVSAAEQWAEDHGYPTMGVRSNMKRVEARPFYEGLGYAITKSQNVYRKALRRT
jgi:GNAT superfamily N-acetyltransferase